MLETLAYLVSVVITVVVLVKVTPPGTSPAVLIGGTIEMFAVVATARHGPTALVPVLEALARLLSGR